MGSLQNTHTTGVGVELYKWLLATLPCTGRKAGYRRLNAPVRRRIRVARLGKRKAIRALKMRRVPRLRLRLRWFSPFTLLAKIRDTYVQLLQAASERLAVTEGIASFPGLACDLKQSQYFPRAGGGDLKVKERELDRILELYMARTGSQIVLTNVAA